MIALLLIVALGTPVLAWLLHRSLNRAQGWEIAMTWYHEPDGYPGPWYPLPIHGSVVDWIRALPPDWEVEIRYEHEPAPDA